jgi:hypothetical protein
MGKWTELSRTTFESLSENAIGVLTDGEYCTYRSFCSGCDELERAGLIDHDGQNSELANDIIEMLRIGAPLSDITRSRVEIAEQCPGEGKEGSFSMGYANGKADAIQSVRDAISALDDD